MTCKVQTRIGLYDQRTLKGLLESETVNHMSNDVLLVSNWSPFLMNFQTFNRIPEVHRHLKSIYREK